MLVVKDFEILCRGSFDHPLELVAQHLMGQSDQTAFDKQRNYAIRSFDSSGGTLSRHGEPTFFSLDALFLVGAQNGH